MKNVTSFNNKVVCYSCMLNGFFCYTPDEQNCCTCPLCGELDLDAIKHDNNFFCKKCKIIFLIGCIHGHDNTLNNCYNGHLVSKWLHIPTNNTYIGMPQFDNVCEYMDEIKNISILEYICPNNGWKCKNSNDKSVCNLR